VLAGEFAADRLVLAQQLDPERLQPGNVLAGVGPPCTLQQQVIGTTVFSAAIATSERAIAAAQVALGEDRFSQLRTAGQTLRLQEAAALAGTISIPHQGSNSSDLAGTEPSSCTLTPREREVLRLLVAGRTDREIATTLFIGHRTVQDHVSHILGKLQVANRTEAATVATRDGLV